MRIEDLSLVPLGKRIYWTAIVTEFDCAVIPVGHNTFMAVPVVFIMISNHFPVATYGNTYNWEVLVALVLLGWVAAKVIRES